jgi:hypothetical protein
MSVKLILKVGIVIVLLSLFVLGIFTYWTRSRLPSKFPLDQNLITLFSAHHEAFEKLRKMADEDWGRQAYFSAFDSTSKIAGSRQQKYDNLLSGISSGVTETRDYDGTVRFVLAGQGSAISPDWLKGVEYIPDNYEKKGVIVHDLDDVSKLAPGVYLRQIEPHWFLVYQETD